MAIASQPDPSHPAITAASSEAARKVGAVIYLSSNRPLRLADYYREFQQNWPTSLLEAIGKEPHRVVFRSGHSSFALELRHEPVPDAISEPVAETTLHWPGAAASIAHHVAHVELSGSPDGGVLTFSSDLTRAVASLLPVMDSIAVCWLNGPALNSAKEFVMTAQETFATGVYPLRLWVAVRFEAAPRTLATHGMEQFDAPEIVLTDQTDAAPLMVDYLFQAALSLLSSRHPITSQEAADSPHGQLHVKTGKSATGRKIVILQP